MHPRVPEFSAVLPCARDPAVVVRKARPGAIDRAPSGD
jgi:hypothetical protein